MNKDQKILAEAYDQVDDNPTMAYMGRPEDIHFYADLDGRVRSLQNGVENRGLTYTTVYVKPSKDGWYYTLKPKEDFDPALVPEQDIDK